MQLLIPKTVQVSDGDIDTRFIYTYLPNYIKQISLKIVDKSKLRNIDKEFKIDSWKVIQYALQFLRVSETATDYLLKVDKNVIYNGANIDLLLNIISYGNRSVQGYPFINEVFNFVAENFNSIYEE